jgi:hypothetical protein
MTPDTAEECQMLQAAMFYNAESLYEKVEHSCTTNQIIRTKNESIPFLLKYFQT